MPREMTSRIFAPCPEATSSNAGAVILHRLSNTSKRAVVDDEAKHGHYIARRGRRYYRIARRKHVILILQRAIPLTPSRCFYYIHAIQLHESCTPSSPLSGADFDRCRPATTTYVQATYHTAGDIGWRRAYTPRPSGHAGASAAACCCRAVIISANLPRSASAPK